MKKIDRRFGAIAIDKGLINQEQLVEAVALQKERGEKGLGHKLIGTLLLELGYMSIPQINSVLSILKEG